MNLQTLPTRLFGNNMFWYKFTCFVMENIFQVCIHSTAYTLLQWNQLLRIWLFCFDAIALWPGVQKKTTLLYESNTYTYTVIQYKTHRAQNIQAPLTIPYMSVACAYQRTYRIHTQSNENKGFQTFFPCFIFPVYRYHLNRDKSHS